MTVSIANRIITSPTSLSDVSRPVLALIDGGEDWLCWACAAPSARYELPDETALLISIQQGLHASPQVLLPQVGLLIGVANLMSLAPQDRRILLRFERGDSELAASVANVLSQNRFVTQAELGTLSLFLAELGVADASLFRTLALEDALALHALRLAVAAVPEVAVELNREAAAFSLKLSRTVPEFVDYFECYSPYLRRMDALGKSASQRRALVEAAVAMLRPLLFDALDCPKLYPLASPSAVKAAIRDWIMQGKRLGFPRLSRGIQQSILNCSLESEVGDAARYLIDKYLTMASTFLRDTRVERGRLSQSGSSAFCRLEGGNQSAEVLLDGDGTISLNLFARS